MGGMIDENTICVICSCPNYPYGVIDPVDELSELAGRKKIGLHLDGCMGSFLLPFVDDFNMKTGHTYVDLRIPNVTAFSMDTHKYGLTPKGSGLVFFPNKEVSKALYYGCTDWVGGLYGTPMIVGSRSSAMVAGAWAVMMAMGREGYRNHAKKIFDATLLYRKLLKGSEKYIKVVGKPVLGNVTIISNNRKIDIWKLGTLMNEKGWYFGSGLVIKSLSLTITDKNALLIEALVKDLELTIQELLDGQQVKLRGFFKIAHDIRFFPSWITNKVVSDSLQELYELVWLKHTPEHKKKLEAKLEAKVSAELKNNLVPSARDIS